MGEEAKEQEQVRVGWPLPAGEGFNISMIEQLHSWL